MKIEYNRNLMGSHMIIRPVMEEEEWERQMVAHSRIEGILFADGMEENGEKALWYNITGKQGLDIILEKEELKAGFLCRLLGGLYEAADRLEAHLLKSDALLLLPECIYVDSGSGQIFFCYYPGNEEPAADAFQRWIEFLMKKVDHRDDAAVELIYGLYEQTGKDGFSLKMLKDLIRFPYGCEERQEEGVTEIRPKEESVEMQKEPEETATEEAGTDKAALSVCRRMAGRMTEWLAGVFSDKIRKKVRRKKAEREEFIFEPDEEEEVPAVEQTVLLSDLTRPVRGILRYEGNGVCGDLKIEEVPYLIGSGDFCDGYIRNNTVSRRHARITRVEDVYFIEDLNSANGTYVGGNLLNCKVKISLQKNEIVVFAEEKFRFI